MFDVDCPQHGRRVLVPVSHIVHLAPGPDGMVAYLRCWCGTIVAWHARRPTALPIPA